MSNPVDQPIGSAVYPPRPDPPGPGIDARSAALIAFRRWLATLQYAREGARPGEVILFRIAEKDIFIDWQDYVRDLKFASLVIVPSRGEYDYSALGPPQYLCWSADVYGEGTALVQLCEYTEQFALEAWASKAPERRAVVAAIERAMSANEGSTRLRLPMPEYYGLTAGFTIEALENIDDPDSARNRRRGHMFIKMETPVVRLANYKWLTTQTRLFVDEENEPA